MAYALSLQVLLLPRQLNKEFSPKIKAHFPIYSSTYLQVSLVFHFIFVMNYVTTTTLTNFRCPAPTVH